MTKQELIAAGFTPRRPSEVGLWMLASGETEFEPQPVAITGLFGALRAHDVDVGVLSVEALHGNLIEPHWKKLA